ncbi:hypothetical protein Har1131_07180 [Haloarcula sp. CBA1131]|uniref:sulfatase n=1 Tax=Haloarcula sp. CBA1131 TaxID=1853686 RepID=UPI001244D2B2|nr:sulfatase [Haloarcula sp. CBA1131]KAA9406601.1 hypothetical protein Har1131_07180 [Haloarcula sp. CBA1131]
MDVILSVVDSLRADHVSAYGYDRATTPNLDTLAEEGRLFTRCFSPSTWTRPVASSLLTGRYPPAHGVETRSDGIPDGVPLLSEAFASAGFETLCVTSMGNVSSATGFDRGFDDVIEVYKHPEVLERRTTTTADRELLNTDQDILAYPKAEDLNRYLFEWFEEHEDEDTFVLLWAIDPHSPYDPPNEFSRFSGEFDGDDSFGRDQNTVNQASTPREFRRLENLYDDCINYWDDKLGELRSYLQSNRPADDSIVAVVGDHGEAFGERVLFRNPARGHNTIPHDEQTHVPFVLKTSSTDGGVHDEVVSLIDVPYTLLRAADVDPEFLSGQGSVVWEPGVVSGHEFVFSRTQSRRRGPAFTSVRSMDRKLISIDPPDWSFENLKNHLREMVGYRFLVDGEMLYRVDEDPRETENRVSEDIETASELRAELDLWYQECRQLRADESNEFQNGVETEQLEALGYKM